MWAPGTQSNRMPRSRTSGDSTASLRAGRKSRNWSLSSTLLRSQIFHDEESRGEVPASREAVKRARLLYGGQWYGGHEKGSAKCRFGCTIEGRTRDQLAPHLTKIGACVHREDPANKAKVDDILAGRRNKDADILWMFAPQPPADAPPSLSSSSPPPPSPSASSNDQPEVPAGATNTGGPPG